MSLPEMKLCPRCGMPHLARLVDEGVCLMKRPEPEPPKQAD